MLLTPLTLLYTPLTLRPPLSEFSASPASDGPSDAVFIADRLDDWLQPTSTKFSGLLVKRAFDGKFDVFQSDIDDWGRSSRATAIRASRRCTTLSLELDKLLDTATLPAPLSSQIHEDAFSLVRIWECLCPTAEEFEVKLEM